MLLIILAVFFILELIYASIYLGKLPKSSMATTQLILSIVLLGSVVGLWAWAHLKGMNSVPELIPAIVLFGSIGFCILSIVFASSLMRKLPVGSMNVAVIQLVLSIIFLIYLSGRMAFAYNIIPMSFQRRLPRWIEIPMTLSLD